MSKNISVEIGADGIALITWAMPGRSMNVLRNDSTAEFAAAVERVLTDPAIKGAVVTSAKPAFIAGADLDELEQLAATEGPRDARARQVYDAVMVLHNLFRRIETGGKPFAAAINGTALGGGFELCLACHYRVAADDPKMQIGLPEAKVGLLPGAGGTQRYNRIMGALESLPLLLEGRGMPPAEALKRKLVDRVAPKSEIVALAREWVAKAGKDDVVKPWDKPGYVVPGADPRNLAGANMFSAAYAMQRKRTLGNYVHLDQILKAVYEGMLVPMNAAMRIEARCFTTTLLAPAARNMVRTQFVNLQKANKLSRRPANVPKREITRIGVLGAGMMGAAIAHVSAQAGIEVVLIDRDQPSADKGKEHVRKQNEAALAKGRMTQAALDTLLGRITATTDYEKLRGAQLVIEAVFEDRAIKADVTKKAEAMLGPDAIFASNTSTLPITGLAEASARPERFIGLHFFSPVEKMPLVEIIRGRKTGDEALALAMDFTQRIRKTPIVVNDSRGFFTSRVFGTYTNEGITMLTEGVLPALIENAGKATGMPVAPLALSDEVALDLLYKVNLQTKKDLGDAYVDTPANQLVTRMVEREKRVGKKAGKGFYEYPTDGRKRIWPELAKIVPAAKDQPDVEELKTRFFTIQALEAARCLEEGVITDPADADIGALLGWGFAPWTGGPLSYIEMIGTAKFVATCDQLAQKYGERFKPNALLRKLAASNSAIYPKEKAA
jgi:3-hydroxyacyl-CoA dehydrogenase/enoyl-CoA hydratase/3-hydroxybutyryl-CoA epimerase